MRAFQKFATLHPAALDALAELLPGESDPSGKPN
jgi:hypothetical protein